MTHPPSCSGHERQRPDLERGGVPPPIGCLDLGPDPQPPGPGLGRTRSEELGGVVAVACCPLAVGAIVDELAVEVAGGSPVAEPVPPGGHEGAVEADISTDGGVRL